MSIHEPSVQAEIGIRSAAPVFPVNSLETAMRFYQRLGFEVRRYDAGYAYAHREGLHLHLRASPELDLFSSYSEVYVETASVDELHAEWAALDLMPIRTVVSPDMRAELRRRWAAGAGPLGIFASLISVVPDGMNCSAIPKARAGMPLAFRPSE